MPEMSSNILLKCKWEQLPAVYVGHIPIFCNQCMQNMNQKN